MRIFKIMLKILLVIVFIISVSCSVIFTISAPSTLTNTISSRREIYYKAYNKLNSSKQITIKAKMPYYIEGQTSEDLITCVFHYDSTQSYTCQMISKLFDADLKLIKTSYFPGDGYKYTKVEGEDNGTKSVYENKDLISYFQNTKYGISYYLAFLSYDSKTMKDNYIKYDSSISFNFNKFSLSKKIDIEYLPNNSEEQELSFSFNNHNEIINLVYKQTIKEPTNKTTNMDFAISYTNAKLNFPVLTNYLEA